MTASRDDDSKNEEVVKLMIDQLVQKTFYDSNHREIDKLQLLKEIHSFLSNDKGSNQGIGSEEEKKKRVNDLNPEEKRCFNKYDSLKITVKRDLVRDIVHKIGAFGCYMVKNEMDKFILDNITNDIVKSAIEEKN